MKEKLIGLFLKAKEHKKIVLPVTIAVIALIVIIIIVAIVVNVNKGPKDYEDSIKTMVKALSSESKMKSAIEDVIDLKAAVAWQNADQDADDFQKEYKKLKSDDDDISDLEDALKEWAEENETDEEYTYSVSGIKDPNQSKKNKNIYTVKATIKIESDYSSSISAYLDDYSSTSELEYEAKFVFYKNKIIDVVINDGDDDQSLMKTIL